MDFWTRLIGGTGSLKRQSTANDPQQRLARFKRVYNQILHIWHKSPSLSTDASALDNLRTSFQRLTSILHDESRSPVPHLCLSFSAAQQIYSAIGRIASTSHNEAVVREAVAVFSALIDSEEEEFLANERFAEALMAFISKIASSGSLVVIGEDTDADIVELLFGISAKIRLEPEILPIWFSSRATAKVDKYGRKLSHMAGFAGVTQKEDFPLCYQLIDHVHHEGRIGDFARTGLLYIFESASKSPELEQWIVESDLATLMASGLGALYSQLSRKLSVLHPEKDLPVILALSDYPDVSLHSDVENIFSQEFRIHMETFLSYLAFWQDVLEHCRSVDVRATLIDHFQVLFLSQLLYPSLLESSDVDGGSSVAVLTYLRRILDALDHAELVKKILKYLLNLPDEKVGSKTPLSTARRRSSLMLLTQPTGKDDTLNPSLFNLVDLLINSTQSQNAQTVTAALKLVTVIVSKNHSHATGTLLQVAEVQHRETHRSVGALEAELDSYLSIAADLVTSSSNDLDRAYDALLKDTLNTLETHPCSAIILGLHGLSIPSQAAVDFLAQEQQKERNVHQLIPTDPLFRSLTALLSTFLTNNVEVNLSLTEALINLASCPNLRLEGWLVVEPAHYNFPTPAPAPPSPEEDPFHNILLARRRPTWPSTATPPILSVLQFLHDQIHLLRQEVPDLDAHVRNRKQAFHVHEEINEAMRSTAAFPPPSPNPLPVLPGTGSRGRRGADDVPSRALSPSGGLQQLLPRHVREGGSSRGDSGTHSPSPHPRGRLSSPPTAKSGGASRLLSPAPPGSGPGSRSASRLSPASASASGGGSPAGRARSPAGGKKGVVRSLGEVMVKDSGTGFESEVLKIVVRFPLRGKVERSAQETKGTEEKTADATTPDISGSAEQQENGSPAVEATQMPAAHDNAVSAVEQASGTAQTTDTQVAPPAAEEASAAETSIAQPSQHTTDEAEAKASQAVVDDSDDDNDSNNSSDRKKEAPTEVKARDASLNHVLTNIVILQEFVLELVALLQVRASLFSEVRFA